MVGDGDQSFFLFSYSSSIWWFALRCAQNKAELLILFMNRVIH